MISELSKVPLGWEKVRFGDIAKNVTDRIDDPKTSGLKDYIGLEHLETDEIRIKRYGSPDEVEATKFLCKNGDIIFGKRRAYLRKLAVTGRDAVVSAHSMVLRPKEEKVLPEFLPWFMYSSQFWKTAFAISEGSLSPTIKWKTLSAQEFWLPSKNEQRKIAEILWGIESNVEKLEQLIQVAEKLKKGLLEELLTKGIGHKKFKETEIGDIPEEWELMKVGDSLSLEYGQGLPEEKREGGEYPVVGSNGIVGYHNNYTTKGPTIVVGRKGGSGQIIWVEEDCWPIDTSYFVKTKKGTNMDFAFYLLKSLNLVELSQKGAVPGLNRKDVYEKTVGIPTPHEQVRIASLLRKTERSENIFREHLTKIEMLKKKLTNSFLSGELSMYAEDAN
jgi:type I restriction enzyme S subunit